MINNMYLIIADEEYRDSVGTVTFDKPIDYDVDAGEVKVYVEGEGGWYYYGTEGVSSLEEWKDYLVVRLETYVPNNN